jgi:hypothetical protein
VLTTTPSGIGKVRPYGGGDAAVAIVFPNRVYLQRAQIEAHAVVVCRRGHDLAHGRFDGRLGRLARAVDAGYRYRSDLNLSRAAFVQVRRTG